MTTLVEQLAEQLVTSADPRWAEAGVTPRMLDYWSRTEVLISDNPAPGSGNVRSYLESEIGVAERIVRLRTVGFSLEAAAPIARRGVGIHDIGQNIMIVVGGGVQS